MNRALCPCGEPATILHADGPRCGAHATFDWLTFFETICARGECVHPGHQEGEAS